jgi:serine phosphatase RsbU (regulator of sigma subunit)
MDVQAKNKNIQESITYSKRIQNAILPDNNIIRKCFKDSFMFYKPRDIVSGDFPWFMQKGDDIFIAVVDCTGHGVPGAMLSLVGYFQLNNIVDANPSYTPGHILDELDRKVNETLIKDTNEENIKDGMDIALCKINVVKKTVEYAGAHRPLYQLSAQGTIEEFKGDKWAIGGGTYKNQTKFTSYKINMKSGESIFFFSDGVPDQFGGTDNRKFGTARIKESILANKQKPMKEIHESFMQEFESWRGKEKQTDDVLLIGIKF